MQFIGCGGLGVVGHTRFRGGGGGFVLRFAGFRGLRVLGFRVYGLGF